VQRTQKTTFYGRNVSSYVLTQKFLIASISKQTYVCPTKHQVMAKKKQPAAPTPVSKTTSANAQITTNTTPWLLIVAVCLLITGATWWAYRAAPANDFVDWDDPTYVVENPLFTPVTPATDDQITKVIVSNNYHPITMWSLYRQVKSHGIKAGPMIQTNIWLHIGTALLVFWFFGWLTRGQWWVAAAVALLFGVHPMHVESVAWVSERKDVLYGLFGMGSMIAWLAYVRTTSWGMWALALGLFTLSCLSKGMAVIFPILFLLTDYWEERSLRSGRVWLEKVPFFAISMLFGLIALSVQQGGDFHGWFTRLEVEQSFSTGISFGSKLQYAGYALGQYLIQWIAPLRIAAMHPYPDDINAIQWPYVSGVLVLLAYFGAILWAMTGKSTWISQHRKPVVFALVWGLVSLALVLQFVSVGSAVMADRYTYLPYIGWTFGLVYVVVEISGDRWRGLFWGVLALAAAAYAYMTTREVPVWKDSVALWTRVLEQYPNYSRAYSSRGTAWGKERKDFARAKTDFEAAIRLDPNAHKAYEGLGIMAGMQNDHATALTYFEKCVQISPDDHNYYFNRALAYLQTNQPQRAVPDLQKATQLNSGKAGFYFNYELEALTKSSQWTTLLQRADAQPQLLSANGWSLKAQAHLMLQQIEPAKTAIGKALSMEPNNALAKQVQQRIGG
jgi:protein O-mannosyl-transferase